MDGRLSDIPYVNSPPLIFTYRETAALAAGQYTFATARTVFTPSRPIQANVLYIFQTMDFACDIAEEDYFGAIATLPEFSMYLQSDASAPSFREPIPLVKYFTNIPYYLAILGSELMGLSDNPTAQGFSENRLLGDVTGILNQTPALVGKASITAIILFSVQEISDGSYISDFRARAGKNSRSADAPLARGGPAMPYNVGNC